MDISAEHAAIAYRRNERRAGAVKKIASRILLAWVDPETGRPLGPSKSVAEGDVGAPTVFLQGTAMYAVWAMRRGDAAYRLRYVRWEAGQPDPEDARDVSGPTESAFSPSAALVGGRIALAWVVGVGSATSGAIYSGLGADIEEAASRAARRSPSDVSHALDPKWAVADHRVLLVWSETYGYPAFGCLRALRQVDGIHELAEGPAKIGQLGTHANAERHEASDLSARRPGGARSKTRSLPSDALLGCARATLPRHSPPSLVRQCEAKRLGAHAGVRTLRGLNCHVRHKISYDQQRLRTLSEGSMAPKRESGVRNRPLVSKKARRLTGPRQRPTARRPMDLLNYYVESTPNEWVLIWWQGDGAKAVAKNGSVPGGVPPSSRRHRMPGQAALSAMYFLLTVTDAQAAAPDASGVHIAPGSTSASAPACVSTGLTIVLVGSPEPPSQQPYQLQL